MKKVISLCMALLLLFALAGCSRQAAPDDASPQSAESAAPAVEELAAEEAVDVDVDLTKLSNTMAYAEVSNMLYNPDNYVGKTVRLAGQSFSAVDEASGQTFHSVVVADSTVCCTQGFDYVLTDEDAEYPKDYSVVVVTGELELYEELGLTFCRLKNATLGA